MIKIFCDACGKEIAVKDDFSEFQYLKRVMTKQGLGKQPTKETFCEDCTEIIKKAISDIQEHIKKGTQAI